VSLKTLSPSRAADFKACPQLFRFRAVDKLPEPSTVYQARGTTAHLALQRLYDLPPNSRTPQALFGLFREAWAEVRSSEEFEGLFPTIEEERSWGLESLELLANYFGLENPATVRPRDREYDMTEDLDGIVVRGILDRIDELPNGDLVIVDYKTGKAPPERYALAALRKAAFGAGGRSSAAKNLSASAAVNTMVCSRESSACASLTAAWTTNWLSVAPDSAAAFSSSFRDSRGILALTLSLSAVSIAMLRHVSMTQLYAAAPVWRQ